MSSTDIARTRAAASSMARGSPSSRRTTLSTVVGSSATPGRAARARCPNSSDAASSPSCESGNTRSAEIARGARVVVTTRRRGQAATRKATRSATASTTCSQLSRMSRVGAAPRACAARARTSVRCSGVSTRRPLTESRTPSADPTSPTTSSGEATPTSSTKCTTGSSASRPRRCASRVLPSPPGPEDRHDPGLADQGPQRADVVVATDQGGRLVTQPAPDRVVRGEQLGVHRGQGRARVDTEAVGEVAPHQGVAVERGRPAVHGGERAQQGDSGGLVVDAGLLEKRERLAVVAEGAQRAAQHRTRLRSQPARVVTQVGQRPVATGCRCRAGQRAPGGVTRGRPVAACLGGGRRGDVIAQGERVDGCRGEPQAVATGGQLDHAGCGLGPGARHHDLERLGGVGGSLVGPPHLVDEGALPERPAVGLDQRREEGVGAPAVHGRAAPGDLTQEPQLTGRRVPVLGVGLRHPPSLGGAGAGAGQPRGVRCGQGHAASPCRMPGRAGGWALRSSEGDIGAVRAQLRGVRGRGDLQALARQDRDRVRRPPVLPAHDEPPPAAPRRALCRGVDPVRPQRGRRATTCTRSCSACRCPTSAARRSPTSRSRACGTSRRPSTATPSTARPRCSTSGRAPARTTAASCRSRRSATTRTAPSCASSGAR